MTPDVMTVILWFFLACNPSLAVGNHWQYSAVTGWKTDHYVNIDVCREDPKSPDAWQLELKYLNQDMRVSVYHQLNGYRVVTTQPAGVADQFVPFIPHYIGRPWKDTWKVSTFMDDRYQVGAGVGPSDRVYVADLSDTAKHHSRAMFFDKVGLRRLAYNGWDISMTDVDYAYKPYKHYPTTYTQDPLQLYAHDRNDGVGPDTDTSVEGPPWWREGNTDYNNAREGF